MASFGAVSARRREWRHSVARSLGVPALTRCDLPPGMLAGTDPEPPAGGAQALGRCRPLAAVDGDAGTVCLLGREGDASAG